MVSNPKKTLVFCTAYTGRIDHPWEAWEVRYKRWLRAIRSSELDYDQILIVDDGSPTLPQWPGTAILSALPPDQPSERVVIFHFPDNLGRPAGYDYPGWYRSFTFAADYAKAFGFEKIVHIESDAFLISGRMQRYCNDVTDDWVTFMGPRHGYPETGIQVMAGDGLERFCLISSLPYAEYKGKPVETLLPFTRVETKFVGDRFGEYLSYVPPEADWAMQTYVPSAFSDEYHWWIRDGRTKEERMSYQKEVGPELRHTGVPYLEFMATLSTALATRTYFEIGTDVGDSLKVVRCDAVCVDPHFKVSQNVLEGRRRAHFFQTTADDFFSHYNLGAYLPGGVDLAFLDGLHHFESLLRDFMNTERQCHARSVILLHDCLPSNERMAERTLRVDEAEDSRTRLHWTGDVWKLLPILRKYRPDLQVVVFDCGPTGLVACSGLDPYSSVIQSNYKNIVEEFSPLALEEFGVPRVWMQYPLIDTRQLSAKISDLPELLFGARA
jgi:hypothetical protein